MRTMAAVMAVTMMAAAGCGGREGYEDGRGPVTSYEWPIVPQPDHRAQGLSCYSMRCPCRIMYASGKQREAGCEDPVTNGTGCLAVGEVCGTSEAEAAMQADAICAWTIRQQDGVEAACSCSGCRVSAESD